jgi:hypothetical protein
MEPPPKATTNGPAKRAPKAKWYVGTARKKLRFDDANMDARMSVPRKKTMNALATRSKDDAFEKLLAEEIDDGFYRYSVKRDGSSAKLVDSMDKL